MDIISELNTLLEELYRLRRDYTQRIDELADYAGLNLSFKTDHSTGMRYYSCYGNGETRRKYLGPAANIDVQRIRELRFLTKARSVISDNIALIERFKKRYRPYDMESVNNLIGKTYRLIGSIPGIPGQVDVAEWLAETEAKKASFKVFRPEQLRHRTLCGILTRSKTEAILSNYYYQNGIPFVYECPHLMNGERINTDFTVLSLRDHAEKFHEHEGMMHDPEYRKKHLRRIHNYMAAGHVPNVDLFFTFEDYAGNFDMRGFDTIARSNFMRG